MRAVQHGPLLGVVCGVLVLGAVALTAGLTWAGWAAGLVFGAVLGATLAAAMRGARRDELGPADWVTLARATLVGGVLALTVDSLRDPAPVPVPALVVLSSVALVLDGVDGRVARRTHTASDFGARFDMEVDAFLILVLSVFVAPSVGWWVLAIGLARYALLAAGWLFPWLRRPVPRRYWRKVVAATQGVVLTIAAAQVLPSSATTLALAGALALLAESFGRDVLWLARHRLEGEYDAVESQALAGDGASHRAVRAGMLTALASLVLLFCLLVPNRLDLVSAASFLRIPIEGVLLVAIAVLLPPRARRALAVLAGLLLGLLTVVKVLDMGFLIAFDRPANLAVDWTYFGSAVDLLTLSVGRRDAILVVAAAGVLVLAILLITPLATVRVAEFAGRHRSTSVRVVAAASAAWIAFAGLGLLHLPGGAAASASAAELAYDHALQVVDGVRDEQTFAEAAAVDPLRRVPDDQLVAGLRGKDVIVAFVESYGRVAVQDSSLSSGVDAVLDEGTRRLRAAGFAARSAFLTSPTFGGISWLAHSTLQSGLWIDSQLRYDRLLETERTTLSGAFKRAGWRTVGDIPSNEQDWKEGSAFYRYDALYDARNVGYRGPPFSYASMPDQYVLAAFQRRELADPDHPPVMAEIDLVSSHTPWTPLPHLVDWSAVGDGSVFDAMPRLGESRDVLWRDADNVRSAYGQSIQYSLNALFSFVETYGSDNLVLIVLGDHQPAAIVSGSKASHDVPITIIAHDPAVMDRIAPWHWQAGTRPHPDAPVWRMDAFRDRFLSAFAT